MTAALDTSRRDAALALARAGFHVLPLYGPNEGTNNQRGKGPRLRGWQTSRLSPAELAAWFDRHPDSNVGVRTGREAGCICADVDIRKGGDAWIDANIHRLTTAIVVTSGGGGRHFWYRHPGGYIATKIGYAPGVDLMADGGAQVVVPPSIHRSGGVYAWAASDTLLDLRDFGDVLPDWIAVPGVAPTQRERKRAESYADRPEDVETCRAKLMALAGAVEGQGGDSATFKAACLGRDHDLSPEVFWPLLCAWNETCQPPWALEPLREKMEHAYAYAKAAQPGQASPAVQFAAVEVVATQAGTAEAEAAAAATAAHALDVYCAERALTDIGNADRIAARLGADIRYVADAGRWLHWDGRRWAPDETAVRRRVAETMRAIDQEVTSTTSDDRRKAMRAWATKSQSRKGVEDALTLARTWKRIAVRTTELDADPWLLNCPNGTLDIRTGELRPHRREDLLTKLCGAAFDSAAQLPLFDRFLHDATGGNAELADFLSRAFGYTATGVTTEEKLFLVHGSGGGGKSTLIAAVKTALGDYAMTSDFATFMKSRNGGSPGGPRGDLARLAGARFVSAIEAERGQRLAEGLVKSLTGGDTVTARHLHRSEVEFKPQFKLWLVANDRPRVNDDDSGIWRRVLDVPFNLALPKEKQDPAIKEALEDPARGGPAVLAWLVRGALAWRERGLEVPEVVKQATQEYQEEMDPLKEWLADCCQVGIAERYVPVTDLRASYEQWCRGQGQKFPLGRRQFNARLEAMGCERRDKKIKTVVTAVWMRIGFRPSVYDHEFGPEAEVAGSRR